MCTPKHVGYDRGPEVVGWLTRTQVLFPIGAVVFLREGQNGILILQPHCSCFYPCSLWSLAC